MADYLPRFKPGQTFTCKASAAVTGGQLVVVTGDRRVGPAGATSTAVVGVAGFDAAVEADVTIHAGGVQRLTASAAIAAGAEVESAADGQIATATTAPIGVALAAASTGDVVDVLMNR
ncbi:capsid cement protein [Propionibacteriaceae bacterium Y2011]